MNNKAGHRANPEKLFNEETAKGRVTDQNRDTDGESHHPGSQSKNVEPTPLPGNLRAETFVGIQCTAKAPQLDAKHDGACKGGKAAHGDGDRDADHRLAGSLHEGL